MRNYMRAIFLIYIVLLIAILIAIPMVLLCHYEYLIAAFLYFIFAAVPFSVIIGMWIAELIEKLF